MDANPCNSSFSTRFDHLRLRRNIHKYLDFEVCLFTFLKPNFQEVFFHEPISFPGFMGTLWYSMIYKLGGLQESPQEAREGNLFMKKMLALQSPTLANTYILISTCSYFFFLSYLKILNYVALNLGKVLKVIICTGGIPKAPFHEASFLRRTHTA